MTKTFLIFGSLFAALGVILGAFDAHALKGKLSLEQLQIFETGVRYQMYHSIALILVFLLGTKLNNPLMNTSGWFFLAGIVLFSGSLFLLSSRELLGIEGWSRIIGPITPIGGLCLIIGWVCLLVSALKLNN